MPASPTSKPLPTLLDISDAPIWNTWHRHTKSNHYVEPLYQPQYFPQVLPFPRMEESKLQGDLNKADLITTLLWHIASLSSGHQCQISQGQMRSDAKDKLNLFLSRWSLLLATSSVRRFSLPSNAKLKQRMMEFDLLLILEQGKTLIWHEHSKWSLPAALPSCLRKLLIRELVAATWICNLGSNWCSQEM